MDTNKFFSWLKSQSSNYEAIVILVWVLAGLCVFLACLISVISIWNHFRHYQMPTVQRYAVRIILMIPIFAINSYLSLLFKDLAFYFNVIRDTYEAYVLFMFFRLLIELAEGEENLIGQLEVMPQIKYLMPFCCFHIKPGRIFLHRCKQFILQYVFVKIALTISTFITEIFGVYEEGSFSPKHGYLYTTIIYNLSICLSLYFLVLFYEATKGILHAYKPLMKFICIKSIVFFTFWQGLAISVIVGLGMIKKGYGDYSISDLQVALQSFLICVEMFPLAIMFAYCFGWKSFHDGKTGISGDGRQLLNVIGDSFKLHDVIDDTRSAVKKGPKRNVQVGLFLDLSREEQLSRVLKQDWIKKRGEDIIKKWKNRYFLLIADPLGLVFFKRNPFLNGSGNSNGGEEETLSARGFIPLGDILHVIDTGKRTAEFILVTSYRKWHLQAQDDYQKMEWVRAINDHIPKSTLLLDEGTSLDEVLV